MSPEFLRTLREATRLTRSGDAQAATALIRTALAAVAGAPEFANGHLERREERDDTCVIDVEAREVADPRRAPPAPSPAGRDDRTLGEGFHAGVHAGPSGSRPYKLYVPPERPGRSPALVVMLHGCTQDPDDFAAGTAMNEAAAAEGFYVLYPAQTTKANPQRCWSWFKHTHQRRGRGEPAILADMTREILAHHPIDADRVYVAGLSAGGAMAAILGEAYPDLFAAVGVHSGLAAAAAGDLPSALAAMKGSGARAPRASSGMPTIVFHGDADATVHANNGACVLAASVGDSAAGERQDVHEPGGCRSTRLVHRDASGRIVGEHWIVHGGGHAWFGGRAAGSHTDPRGPDATRHMLRFFFQHRRRARG